MPDPIYRRIAEDLRQKIESGELAPGSQLPTEVDLRDVYDASRNTIRDAVKWLISRGLVETRLGQGTFVVEKFEPFITTLSGDWQDESGLGGGEGRAALEEVKARHRMADASEPRVEVRRAAGYVADRLQVSEDATVISRHQERSIDGQPWSLQTSFYPFDYVRRGAARLLEASNIDEGTVSYLADTLKLKQVGYRDLIAVRPPDENEIRFFRLPVDGRTAVCVLLRTGFARGPDGLVPFRLTESVFPSDRNQFVINAGEVPYRLGVVAEI